MALRATLRLRANEGVLSRAVSRQEVGHHDAQKKAAKLSAELSARKAEVEAAELRVKTARRTLMKLPTRPLPAGGATDLFMRQQRQEAIRETARDCVRRERLAQLAAFSQQADNLTARTANDIEATCAWERSEKAEFREMLESEVQRKVLYEDMRTGRALTSGDARQPPTAICY